MAHLGVAPPAPTLLLGGNGFIGLNFVEAALAEGSRNLTLVNRGNNYWDSAVVLRGIRTLRCDRTTLSTTCVGLREQRYSYVVDFNPRNANDVHEAMKALRGGPGAPLLLHGYVLLSSSVAYAPFAVGQWFRGGPFDEDAVPPAYGRNVVQTSIASADRYMAGKLGAEDALRAHAAADASFCTTVLRLPYVIGERDSTHRLALLLMRLEARVLVLSAAARIPISFVDAHTVASAILHVLSMPISMPISMLTAGGTQTSSRSDDRARGTLHAVERATPQCGGTFNVALEPLSLEALLRAAAAAYGAEWDALIRHALLPGSAAEAVYEVVPIAPLLPYTLSSARLRSLGWTPPTTAAEAAAAAGRFIREALLPGTDLSKCDADAQDRYGDCAHWAAVGECGAEHADFMREQCKMSCGGCDAKPRFPAEAEHLAWRFVTSVVDREPSPLDVPNPRSVLWAHFRRSPEAFGGSSHVHRHCGSAELGQACADAAWADARAISAVFAFAVLLGVAVPRWLRLRSPALRETLSLGCLGAAWAVLLSQHGLFQRATAAASGLAVTRPLWNNERTRFLFTALMYLAISSEVVLGIASVVLAAREAMHASVRVQLKASREAVAGPLAWAMLHAARIDLGLFFLHKLVGRFHDEGLGNGRGEHNELEFHLPGLIVSHEPFAHWHQAAVVIGVYALFLTCILRLVHAAIGRAAGGRPSWLLAFLCLGSVIAIFEAHHTSSDMKMRVPAARWACLWVEWTWLALMPCAALFLTAPRVGTAASSPPDHAQAAVKFHGH